jgi:predicted HicB family RNase H-like nuclease
MKNVKLNTRIPAELRKRLKVKAARDGVSIQKLVAEALEKYLK